jgi:ABC-2 type transport system permease protein
VLARPLYYMIGLTAFGTMNTVLSTGARIAVERAAGWNRQLRLTPLSTRSYFRAKVITAYLLALITIVTLHASGISLGAHLTAGEWARMTGLTLVGLIPFVALGVLMGHLLTAVWFPIQNGALHKIAEALPSYRLVQARHVAIGAGGWGARGSFVMAAGPSGSPLWPRGRTSATPHASDSAEYWGLAPVFSG